MGQSFLDQYSLLHFAAGVIAYFWGMSFSLWLLINILYEIIENRPESVAILHKYGHFWPGGKKSSDSVLNSAGDIISGMAGWSFAYLIDNMGKKYNWYS